MLMSELVKKIEDKLREYNYSVYNHYPVDKKEYVFLVQDMVGLLLVLSLLLSHSSLNPLP